MQIIIMVLMLLLLVSASIAGMAVNELYKRTKEVRHRCVKYVEAHKRSIDNGQHQYEQIDQMNYYQTLAWLETMARFEGESEAMAKFERQGDQK